MKGAMSRSTAFPSIFENALMKLMSEGSMSGNTSGTVIAAMMFDMSVYAVSDAALPPSLPVMTAAAVAVGHISMTTMPSSPYLRALASLHRNITTAATASDDSS